MRASRRRGPRGKGLSPTSSTASRVGLPQRVRSPGALLNVAFADADDLGMDASAYAFVHGVRSTRGALAVWRDRPWPVLRVWLLISLAAATLLLAAVWAVAAL